jgi:hypothetical protein
MDETVAEYVSRFRLLGLTGSPFRPEQVASLERHLGLLLPAAYKAYLLIAGEYPPPALVGSDCHGGYLYQLRDGAKELLRECGNPFELPADAVVFMMHQGYQFMYFCADSFGDDPPVFYFIEGMTREYAPEQRLERFSAWVKLYV